MTSLKQIMSAAATVSTFALAASPAGSATVHPNGNPLQSFDRLTHQDAAPSHGNPNLGQILVTPVSGHATGAPQVYAVRDEKGLKQCIIGSHLAKKSTAYTAEAFYRVATSGSLAALNPSMKINIDDLTRNGAYAFPANTTPQDGFFRANAGFGIDKVVVFVDGKMLDLTDNVEASNYTTKAEAAINDTIQAAYFDGKPVTYVTLSDNGHTVVDTFQIDPSVIATWNKCLETIENIAIPQSDYITFESIPFPEATPEMIADIKGSQCIKGVDDKDILGVETILSVTGAVIPFSYALVMTDGSRLVSDFFKKSPDGKMYVSKSLEQFSAHINSSCKGNVPVATPPQFFTEFFPSQIPSQPINMSYQPPILGTPRGGGGGYSCVRNCGGGGTDNPPPPSPVGLPLPGVLLAGALGGLVGLRRRSRGSSLEL